MNTTIFSAVDVFLLRPLPYPEPDNVVQVWSTNQERGWNQTSISPADFADWREQSRTVDVAAFRGASFNLRGSDQPERIAAQRASGIFFRVLGIAPSVGRAFNRDEALTGRDQVVVVSNAFWQSISVRIRRPWAGRCS